jgi:ATP-dependent Lon protease
MVVLPKRNEADLEDIPEEVRNSMGFTFVDTVDEVLEKALEPAPRKPRQRKKTAAAIPADGTKSV